MLQSRLNHSKTNAMNNEKRNYSRIDLCGEANIRQAGIVRNSTVVSLYSADMEIECSRQLVE